MTPVDWSAVAGVLFLVATGAVKWLIPGILELVKPTQHNGYGSNGYKIALEAVNRTLGRLETEGGRTREAVGAVGASTGELRVQIAGLEPRVEVTIEEIARLRDQVASVPEQISRAMSRVASQTTEAIGDFREEMDRRLGPIERRLENGEQRMDETERRQGLDNRRGR